MKQQIISSITPQQFGILIFSPTEAKQLVGTKFKLLGYKQEERASTDAETGEMTMKTVTKLAIEKEDGTLVGLATNSESLAQQCVEIFDLFGDLVEDKTIQFKLMQVKVAKGQMLKIELVQESIKEPKKK